MSKKILEEIDNLCRRSAINACWRQWGALGALLSSISPRPLTGMIDPEALLLLSAAFREQERRLDDVISWFASVGSALVSVQRLRSFSSRFPEDLQSGISSFAHTAYEQGDRRWRTFANPREKRARRLKGTQHSTLGEPAAVLLRFRAGFGVGVKSDLLAVLLGMHGSTVTVRRLVEALGYSKVAITVAAQEMAQARLIQETPGRPAGYFIDPEPWARLLRLGSISEESTTTKRVALPTWRYWPQLFAFLSHTSRWARPQDSNRSSNYVLSSKARDLYHAHEHALALNRISVPEPERYRGEEYLDGFRLTVRSLSKWLDENL